MEISHKFHNRSLPKAILNMFNESISDPNHLLRSMKNCALQPKRDIQGTTMYKILGNWNSLGNSIREIKDHSEFKNSLKKKILNSTSTECNKSNCYSCNYDFKKIETLIKF